MSPNVSKFTTGFNNWKHAHEAITSHEHSKQHLDAAADICAQKSITRIDNPLVEQFETEVQYWRQLLVRIVSVIKFLCIRGLAFRGKTELIGSPSNGNYLGILELIGEYNAFLAQHLPLRASKGRGHPCYLSSTICEELIYLMGRKVVSNIVDEIKLAKFFSISIDSTPDVAHVDQLTVVIRYVLKEGPAERFLTFIPMAYYTNVFSHRRRNCQNRFGIFR